MLNPYTRICLLVGLETGMHTPLELLTHLSPSCAVHGISYFSIIFLHITQGNEIISPCTLSR